MKKLVLVIISLLIIASSACSKPSPENSTSTDILDKESASSLAILPEDAPGWVASCNQFPELCVPICQRSAKKCAAQVNTFVTQKQPNGDYLFQSWSQFPNQSTFHANQSTPMHGSYLTIFANDIAEAYLTSVLQKGNNQQLDYVDFPNGSS